MSELGSLIGPDVQDLIRERQWEAVRDALARFDPADVADLLADLPDEVDVAIFRVLPRDRAGEVFAYLPLDRQERLLLALTNEQTRNVLSEMTPDDQAQLLDELPASVTRRILDTLSPDELKAARDLLGYPEDSIGRVMTPRYVALRPEMTAAQALDHIRHTGRDRETLAILYVLDGGRLVHELRLATLVLADPNARVADIPDRAVVSIPATTPRTEAVRVFRKYDRLALPVTDSAGQMVGIVTADDILDVAEQDATDDISRFGGTESLGAPYLEVSFLGMMKKRGGWLSVLFLGEMLTATAMSGFEDELAKAVVLAMFIPLIISSGGNSGSQAATLIVRSLALTEVRLRDWWRVAWRELRAGVALGSWLGMLGFVRVMIWHHVGLYDYGDHCLLIAATIWVSLVGVVTFGSLSGSMLPFLLSKCGFDPATSSAPFVATLVDVTGIVIYFSAAALLLSGTVL